MRADDVAMSDQRGRDVGEVKTIPQKIRVSGRELKLRWEC